MSANSDIIDSDNGLSPTRRQAIIWTNAECLLTNLWTRFEEEAASQQQTLHGGLSVGELDALQVQHTLTVGQDEGIQS